MSNQLTTSNLGALQAECAAEQVHIAVAQSVLAGSGDCGRASDLSPEALIEISSRLDDPNLLGGSATLLWGNLMRERQGLRVSNKTSFL